MTNFLQFEFEPNTAEDGEKLIALLSEQGFEGFVEEGTTLVAFINQQNFLQQEFEKVLEMFAILSYTMNEVENINWNQQWEENFNPVKVDDFVAIRAHFHKPVKNVVHEIVITPKMSFGTGHHATTCMMIQLMEKIDFRNKTVLDFGTGTGVLAILAEKLGARKVLAIDNDEWSIANAAENLDQNNAGSVTLKWADSVPADEKFDIILANINLNVIKSNISGMQQAGSPGVDILLSGFLTSDEKQMDQAAGTFQLEKVKSLKKGEWMALYLKNKP